MKYIEITSLYMNLKDMEKAYREYPLQDQTHLNNAY